MLCFVEGQHGTDGAHLGSRSVGADGLKGLVLLGALGWELGESRKKIARQDDLYIKDADYRLRLLSNRRWRQKVTV